MNTLTATPNHKYTIDRSGIIFNKELTFEEWRDLGMELAPVAKTIGFIVGDWINYGENRYGEKYADAMRMTGLAYDTLRKYAHAARSIQIGNRFPNLDWTHHLAVAKVKDQEEQRKWLELADTDGMSVKRLKMSINAGRPLKPDEVDKDNADRGTVTHLSLINQILRWWKRTTAEDPVDQWDSEQRQNVKKDFARLIDIYDSL